MGTDTVIPAEKKSSSRVQPAGPAIPGYLQRTYWWAYLHPLSVWIFEREWLVNLILFGQMRRLTAAVVAEVEGELDAPALQVACVYGKFPARLHDAVVAGGQQLHIVDVAPIQLQNAGRKLADRKHLSLHHQDSTRLTFPDATFSRTVLFFLLHEQPADVREKSIAEAVRVTRPGGRVILVDYHLPMARNPLRYLLHPVLKVLEPFALDLWRRPLHEWALAAAPGKRVTMSSYGGGLYQKVVIHC